MDNFCWHSENSLKKCKVVSLEHHEKDERKEHHFPIHQKLWAVHEVQKKKDCNKYKLSEQSFSPRLGDVHSFSNYFIMASEQMLGSGARVWCPCFQASRHTCLLLINRDESELESHLPGFPTIPKHHLRVQHIHTPTLPGGGKHNPSSALEKSKAHGTHHPFPPSTPSLLWGCVGWLEDSISKAILWPVGRIQEKTDHLSYSVKFAEMCL